MRYLLTLITFISLSAFSQTGDELFKMVDESVVAIQHERAGGSGFVLTKDGYIMTNGHVVSMMDPENPKDTARRITVIMSDDKKYQAKVIGFSLDPDIALLKIEPLKDLKPVKIGDADKVITGQKCYAFGAPLGQKRTLTGGIISNTARTSLGTFTKVFQMDAIINPGNSGGPLFNEKGEVIGVNTYGGKAGLGFSIPIKYGMVLKEHFLKYGRFVRADIPFYISKAMPEEFARVLGTPQGVFIDYVVPGTDADKAGLQNGDVIIKMDGEDVSGKNEESYYEWSWELVTKKVGSKIEFVVLRKVDGEWKEVKISGILKEDEPAPEYGVQIGELKEIKYPILGMGIQRITLMSYFIYNLPTTKGVRVSSVVKNGSAAKANITNRHVITHINGKEIVDEEDFKSKLDSYLKKMDKYIMFSVASGNDVNDLVVRVNYKLRKRKILVISKGEDTHLPTYTRELELMGAELKISSNASEFGEGDWDGVLISGEDDFKSDTYKNLVNTAADKKLVLGLVGKSPAALTLAAELYKDKKVTMDKEVSPQAIKAGFNYTGKEVEVDSHIVTSTGFDRQTAKAFLEAFADLVSRKTEARD
ncbi:MAG: trypsin-like peptidase domain-containing protein [Lentisphaeraceae bacterium]|nr:trypsin-like peptidase domain-containing protein [Lentisphaeraceae bacterium]